jgi:diphthamide synthase subunit DPH2
MRINAYKVKLAQIFLNRLKKELHKIKSKEEVLLEMYSNGREQGHHLKVVMEDGTAWGCSFSENRNSDQLVVYIGTGEAFWAPFSISGNILLDRDRTTVLHYVTDEFGLRLAVTNTVCSLVMALEGMKQPEAVS